MSSIVEVQQGIAAIDQRPFAQINQADGTGKRRLQVAQGELVAGGIDACLHLIDGGLLPLQHRLGDGATGHQLAHLVKLAVLVAQAGALLGQRCLLLACIQRDQDLPLHHALARLHRNLDDATRDLRADDDGAVGGELAHQLQGRLRQTLSHGLGTDIDLSGGCLGGRLTVAIRPDGGHHDTKKSQAEPDTHFHRTVHEE